MMKHKILQDLYYSTVHPCEHDAEEKDERREVDQKLHDEGRYLESKLPPNDALRFQLFEELYNHSIDLEQCDAFICGFRLGARLTLAILEE